MEKIPQELRDTIEKLNKEYRDKKEKIYLIEARTGCSCCMDDNHFRGPYKTADDAMRRINHYNSPDSEFWPLASQYARRGRCSVKELCIERLYGNKVIIEDTSVSYLNFIDVDKDGKIQEDDEEIFDDWEY